jgi:hypothetical protein
VARPSSPFHRGRRSDPARTRSSPQPPTPSEAVRNRGASPPSTLHPMRRSQ